MVSWFRYRPSDITLTHNKCRVISIVLEVLDTEWVSLCYLWGLLGGWLFCCLILLLFNQVSEVIHTQASCSIVRLLCNELLCLLLFGLFDEERAVVGDYNFSTMVWLCTSWTGHTAGVANTLLFLLQLLQDLDARFLDLHCLIRR